jgi:CTP synthase
MFCNLPIEAVIEEKDKDFSIYEVPLSLVENRLDEQIVRRLGLPTGTLELSAWRELLHRLRNPEHEISIAVVGKYAEHRDAYKSIYEALDHAGIAHRAQIRIQRIQSEEVEREGPERLLSGFDGMLVPGGFGERGIEGKIEAIRFAREREIPFFGICLGMQCAVIEFARNVIGLANAHSTEFNKDTPHPVICLLDEQKTIVDKGGTMRLGAQKAILDPTSHTAECYGTPTIMERHRHRYEFNNIYRQQFAANGMQFAALSPDSSLVEVIELPNHPWFVAVQYHPEFKSKPTKAHPLFAGLIGAAVAKRAQRMERAKELEPS